MARGKSKQRGGARRKGTKFSKVVKPSRYNTQDKKGNFGPIVRHSSTAAAASKKNKSRNIPSLALPIQPSFPPMPAKPSKINTQSRIITKRKANSSDLKDSAKRRANRHHLLRDARVDIKHRMGRMHPRRGVNQHITKSRTFAKIDVRKIKGKGKLRMKFPQASVRFDETPWYREDQNTACVQSNETATTASTSTEWRNNGLLPTSEVTEEALQKLDTELFQFAEYVRLTPIEVQAREFVIAQVTEIAQRELGPSRQHSQIWPASDSDSNVISVQAFGSYAAREVCMFSSDVDLAVWGSVPPVEQTWYDGGNDGESRPIGKQAVNASENKVQKWREALEELDAIVGDDPTVANTNDEAASNGVLEPNEIDSNLAPSDSKEKLFVIDRQGSQFKASESFIGTCSATGICQTQVMKESLATLDPRVPSKAVEQELTVGSSLHAPIMVDDDGDTDVDAEKYAKATNLLASDSDADSADKLESLVEQDPVPLTYACGESCRESSVNGDLEVSFVSHRAPVSISMGSTGPKGETRKVVVQGLKKLGRQLNCQSFIHTVEVRKAARVPIVSVGTHLGFEVDAAMGGHNGTDTSRFASMKIERFRSFAPVVLFLKVLLSQLLLDKLFTGGLGSYKLYVLVASHLETHLSLGGNDRPSEVLLTFLYRYELDESHRSRYLDSCFSARRTKLTRATVVRCEGGSADLHAVYQLDALCAVFKSALQRIQSELEPLGKHSFLSSVVHPTKLLTHRSTIRKNASKVQAYEVVVSGESRVGRRSKRNARSAH